MPSNRKIYWALGILLLLSAVARGFIAGMIELGNDEVYYYTYALYPALSHFDHPLMVGLMIQAFTLNLLYDSEFFIRLAPVVLGTINTFMIFLIGARIKNPITGFYAALLFTASFYGFILTGTFILPDVPQVFFWLLTLYLLVRSLPDRELGRQSRNCLFLAGITIGFALLSKYHAAFLPLGAFLYMLFYNRSWFRAIETYLAMLAILLMFLPVVFWNMENDFISFTYHENRIGLNESGIQIQYFLTEVIGQIFYNNPFNVVLIVVSFVALMRGKSFIDKEYRRILLWTSVPLFLVFLSFSLFRSTLPHWTGPAYLGFILIAASWLSEPGKSMKLRLVPWSVVLALAFMTTVGVIGVGQIRYGWIPLQRYQADDVSTDLAGWKQLGDKFAPLARWDETHYLIDKDSPILTFRWFPAANFDYYIGRRYNKKVYCLGALDRIHKYHWINADRGNLLKGCDAWYIGLSDDYEDPAALYGKDYELVLPSDTIYITRGNDTIRKAYLFRLIDRREDLIFVAQRTLKVKPVDATVQPVDSLAMFMQQIRLDEMALDILQKRSVREGTSLNELIRREAQKMLKQARDMGTVPDTLKR